MKAEVITFLERFDIEHATPDSQMAYMFIEWDDFEVADKFGKSYGQNEFFENDQRKVINDLIKSNRPKWVIALYNSATIVLKRRFQRKILINPTVTYNDLNNVSEFDRHYTYGFFDKDHEKDYELFQKVYPYSAWYGDTKGLRLCDIEAVVKGILEDNP